MKTSRLDSPKKCLEKPKREGKVSGEILAKICKFFEKFHRLQANYQL